MWGWIKAYCGPSHHAESVGSPRNNFTIRGATSAPVNNLRRGGMGLTLCNINIGRVVFSRGWWQ